MSNKRYSMVLIVIALVIIAVLYSASIYYKGEIAGILHNCQPAEKTALYPLTPGESYSDHGKFFTVTMNTKGEGAPSARTYLSINKDRFVDTADGEAYFTTWRDRQNLACFTVYATPTGQRTTYLWMSDQALSLMGLATPIPTP